MLIDYMEFVKALYLNCEIDWNPDEHDEYDLPPIQTLKEYFRLFPT